MLTLRNDLARAFAQAVARDDLDAANLETLRAGLRLAGCLLDASAAAPAAPAALAAVATALGDDPAPARLERHARGALAAGYRALRTAAVAGSPEERRAAMAAAAEATFQFGQWCRHSGQYELWPLLDDAALAAWPAGERVERRLWVAYFRATTDIAGSPGRAAVPHALDVAATLEAQMRAAQRPDLLAQVEFLRGFHEVHCGRFGEGERIARAILRAARRAGDRLAEAIGLNLATTSVGRQGRHADAAAYALAVVQVEEAPTFMRISSLQNLGIAFQAMGVFEPALEAYAASLEWHRRVDEYPSTLVRVMALRQVLELYALRGDRREFLELHGQLRAAPMLPYDRVFFHRDAATGFMRFGEVDAALDELAKAQSVAEQHGYHYDWFAVEAEIQTLRNVHSQGRDVAHLERPHAELVRSARAAWQTLETDRRILSGNP